MKNTYSKNFVGREKLIESFFDCYNNYQEDYKVINYYGMTGMGKSRLIRELEEILEKQKSHFIKIDMDYCMKKDSNLGVNVPSREEILMKMRNQLMDKYKFKFKKFDETLYKYYLSIGIKKESPEIQAILQKDSGQLGQIGDLAKELIPQYAGVMAVAKIGKNIASSFFNKNKENEETEKLYSKITKDFETDLLENLENKKKKIVVFIDSYEILENENTNSDDDELVENWFENDIVKPSNNILWVIAGREAVNWDKRKYQVKKYELTNFSKDESITFLQKAGIKNYELCNKIYQNSKGMPIYLSLCVDQYNSLKEENEYIDISKFGYNLKNLSDNIIRNLSIEDQEILSYLACTDNWTDDFIINHGSKFITCFSYIRYAKLKSKSFVLKNDNGTYSIMGIAKDLLYKRCDKNIKKVARLNLANFYKEQLQNEKLEIDELVDILFKYVKNNILLENNEMLATEDFEVVIPKLEYIKLFRKYEEVINILNSILPKFSNQEALSKIYKLLIRTLIENGKYKDAESQVMQYEKILNENSTSDDYTEMIELKSQVLIYLHRENEAIEILEKENIKKPENISIQVQLALVYGRQKYDDKKNKAIEMLSNLLQIDSIPQEEKAFLTRSIANIYSIWGKLEEAINIYDELIKQSKDEIEISYLEHDKATPLSRLGRYDDAIASINKALEIRERNFGMSHTNTLNSLSVKANILSNAGKFDEAIEIYIDVYNRRVLDFGETSYYSINTLNNLAKTYYYKGDKNKAYELFNKSKGFVLESNISNKDRITDDIEFFIKSIINEEGEING